MVDIMGGKARWETHCPHCGGMNGTLDMVMSAGHQLQYVFPCQDCGVTWDVGLVMGPTPALREKYLAFLDA